MGRLNRGIHDRFAAKLAERVATMTVGDGMGAVDIGPIINDAAIAKIRSHLEDAS